MKQTVFKQLLNDPDLFHNFEKDLKAGQVVALPTDTLFGLGADAQSMEGVARIYDVKGRENDKPLILFISHIDRLASLGIYPTPETLSLLKRHWPGALTAIFPLPQSHPLKAFVHPTVGIRIPDHQELLHVLRRYSGFLLTTSANRSGQAPLNQARAIREEFGEQLDWLIDGDQQPSGAPSTVADFSKFPPQILRQGAVKIEGTSN